MKTLLSNSILTTREIEILRLSGLGKTSKEIAVFLHIERETVNTHKKHILKKTNTRSLSSAIAYSFIVGILKVDDFTEMLSNLGGSLSTTI